MNQYENSTQKKLNEICIYAEMILYVCHGVLIHLGTNIFISNVCATLNNCIFSLNIDHYFLLNSANI